MDNSTRQMIGACYIAACEAAGPGVLDSANRTLSDVIGTRAVDPVACAALSVLVRSCADDEPAEPLIDRANDVAGKLNDVAGQLHQLVNAVGSASLLQLTANIRRRVARLSPCTDPAEIAAVADMLEAVDTVMSRFAQPLEVA